jgi:hypothetical protein
MTTTQACGLSFGAGLVTAVTLALIWRTKYVGRLIVRLFSRGDR